MADDATPAPLPVTPPNVVTFGGVTAPCYLRMVRPRPLTASLDEYANAVFLKDKTSAGRYSFFRVGTDDDFRRAVTGLLSGRQGDGRFLETIRVVFFTEAELTATGAVLQPTAGHTACRAANVIQNLSRKILRDMLIV